MKLRAESLVHGGDTIGRLEDGRVVFLRGAAPGDLVEAEVVADDGPYLRARTVRVTNGEGYQLTGFQFLRPLTSGNGVPKWSRGKVTSAM